MRQPARTVLRRPVLRPASTGDMWFVLVVGLVVLAYAVLFWEQLHSGLEFDESYNLSVAMNLADGHGYAAQGAAHGELRTPFDPYISTGPTLLLPTALAWLLSDGFGPLVRVPALAFFFLYVAGAFVCGRRLGGRWAGLAAAAAPLLIPAGVPDLGTYSLVPGRIVGEFTACALLVWAALLLPSRRGRIVFLGGLCAGLTFETKTSFVFAVAFVGLGWLVAEGVAGRTTLRRALLAASGVLAPIIVWELYRRVSLGARDFDDNTAAMIEFASSENARQNLSVITPRLRDLAHVFTEPRLALLAVVVAAGLAGVVVVARRTRRDDDDYTAVATLAVLGLSGLLLGLVWLTMSHQSSARQGMPTLLLTLPLLFSLVVVTLRSATEHGDVGRRATRLAVGIVAGGLAVTTAAHTWGTTWNTQLLEGQRAAADVIVDSGSPSIMTAGWMMHAEYQLLTGLPSDRAPGAKPATVLIFTPVEGPFGPGRRGVASPDPCPGREIFASWAAVVCPVE